MSQSKLNNEQSNNKPEMASIEKEESHLPTRIDIRAFFSAIENKPIFTRASLMAAVEQCNKASRGETIALVDCFGQEHSFETKDAINAGLKPQIAYNSVHILADTSLPMTLTSLSSAGELPSALARLDPKTTADAFLSTSKLPLFIDFKASSAPTSASVDLGVKSKNLATVHTLWQRTRFQAQLTASLSKLVDMAGPRVTNVICIALGTMGAKAHAYAQHVVAAHVARTLAGLYAARDASAAPSAPIRIFAQDPSYTEDDVAVFGAFDPEVTLVHDPDAFLMVDGGSLVMSVYPSIPVKQIVADLAKEKEEEKGGEVRVPAALLWNDGSLDGGEVPEYEWGHLGRFANPGSPAVEGLMGGFEKVFGGEGGEVENLGFDWLLDVELWARKG